MSAVTACLSRPPHRKARTRWAAVWLGAALLIGCATSHPPELASTPAQTPGTRHKPVAPSIAERPAPRAPAPAAPNERPAEVVGPTVPQDGGTPEPASAEAAEPGSGIPLARGLASWYGPGFQGRRTASGERYDMHALTAAHKTLPFGTKVRVRSLHTGKEVVVRINDRGPYRNSRIIDLSMGAITALGLRHRGVTEVVLLRE